MRVTVKLNPEIDAKMREIEKTIMDLKGMLSDLGFSMLIAEKDEPQADTDEKD